MYKNFTLTESEKAQILKQHKNHGYKKPLNEDFEDGMDGEIENTNDGGLKIDKNVFAPINHYIVEVIKNESEDPIMVDIRFKRGEVIYEVGSYLEDGDDPEKYISVVRQAVENGLLDSMPDGILIDAETKKIVG